MLINTTRSSLLKINIKLLHQARVSMECLHHQIIEMVIYLTNSRVWTLSPSWENLNEGFLVSSMTMMKIRFLAIHSWEAEVHKIPFKISWATWKENSSAALDCELQDFLIVILSKMALVAVLTSPHLLAIIKETSSFRIIGLHILMKAERLLPNRLTINLNNNSSRWWTLKCKV